MKRTSKVLSLLILAAAMFMGCKQNAAETPKSINEPLFSEDDVTIDSTTIELSDGNWTYRIITTYDDSDDYSVSEVNFKVTNNNPDLTVDHTVKFEANGTFPANFTEQQKETYKQNDIEINGDKYSYSKEFNKADIEALDDTSLFKPIIDRLLTYSVSPLNGSSVICKTNSDKTKFFYKSVLPTYPGSTSNYKMSVYLAKN